MPRSASAADLQGTDIADTGLIADARDRAPRLARREPQPMSLGRQSHHRDRAAGLLCMRGQLWLGPEVLLPESIPLRSFGDRSRGFELSAVDLDRSRRVGF